MATDQPPFEGEPRTDREWRILYDWRLRQVENRLGALAETMVTTLLTIIAGVVIYLLTTQGGGPAG